MKYLVVDEDGCNYSSDILTNDMLMRVREGRFVIIDVENERQTSCKNFHDKIEWVQLTKY